jgi:N-sulfoglucosamine sulfohydrolase
MTHPLKLYLFAALMLLCLQASIGQERPNILICITDDQSWVHTSRAGEKAIATSAFDQVASQGLYFSHAFCAAPSCSPSRGSLLTGMEMWLLGEAANLFSAVPGELEDLCFPLLLKKRGYHLGYTQKGWAPNDFRVHGWKENPLGESYNKRTLQAPTSGIVVNNYAANFKEFLNLRPTDRPFFFWFGSSEPHRKFEENSGVKFGLDYTKIGLPGFLPDVSVVRNDMADYLLEIQWVDQHLARMIALLEGRGLLDNTIIIVSSDNGMAFPSAKNNLYEYGLHVPLAIQWNRGIKGKGRVVEDLVSLCDLAPTLLETAGLIPPEKMTGRSLRHIFESDSSGKAELHREYVFAGKERHTLCRDGDLPYPQRSVRDVRFLYIRNYEPERWPAGSPDSPSVHGWIYGDIDESPSQNYLLEHQLDPAVKPYFDKAMSKRPAEELYDVIRDPACMNNLADSKEFHREKQSLSEVLQDYLEETGDPRALGQTSTWDYFPYYFKNPEGVVPYSAIKQEK